MTAGGAASALWIEERCDGVAVRVKASPGASRDRIVGCLGDAIKVAVSAAPEHGKANDRILAVLAEAIGVPARSVMLLTGTTSRDKRVLVRGLGAAELRQRLALHLDR